VVSETHRFQERPMKITKWGNSLGIRLPLAVVKALGVKEGDQVDVRLSGERMFVVLREPRPEDASANVPFQPPSRWSK
jgi:antitoxin MazE